MTDVAQLFHSPAEMRKQYVKYARDLQESPGFTWGLPSIDKYVIPFSPATLTVFLGRPGDGKSSCCLYLAKSQALRCKDNECVVFISWEETAEEVMAMLMSGGDYTRADVAWGRADLDIIDRQVAKKGLPIYFIGKSINRSGQNVPPVMQVDTVLETVYTMQEKIGVKPTLAIFDYIQRIPVKNITDKTAAVNHVPNQLKDFAKDLGIPVIAAAQSARTVDERAIKLAEYNECQHSSSIEQTADKIFSLWRPARSMEVGDTIPGEFGSYQVTQELMFLRLLKQRGAPARHTWPLHFDPGTLELKELRVERKSLGSTY